MRTRLSPRLIDLLGGERVSIGKALRALGGAPTLLWDFFRLARDTRLASKHLDMALRAWLKQL
jgi:hypothetical protein